jgi:hypothetical protein
MTAEARDIDQRLGSKGPRGEKRPADVIGAAVIAIYSN